MRFITKAFVRMFDSCGGSCGDKRFFLFHLEWISYRWYHCALGGCRRADTCRRWRPRSSGWAFCPSVLILKLLVEWPTCSGCVRPQCQRVATIVTTVFFCWLIWFDCLCGDDRMESWPTGLGLRLLDSHEHHNHIHHRHHVHCHHDVINCVWVSMV